MQGQKLSRKNIVFVPINENNLHWKLLIIDNQQKNYIVLDSQEPTSDIEANKQLFSIYAKAMRIKSNYDPMQTKHSIQKNSWSCGLYTLIVNYYFDNNQFISAFLQIRNRPEYGI